MPDLDVISVVIQGGAIGVLLAFGFGAYQIARKLIDVGSELMTNHLSHLTGTLEKLNDTMERLEVRIENCPAREGWHKDG